MECEPLTTAPPTADPTLEPTRDPTWDPTGDPTSDPTNDPTSDPTCDPTNDPTSDPTIDPTRDPTTDPTTDPTQDPTYDPVGNITYRWQTSVPLEDKGMFGANFIHDAYGKFEVTMTMDLNLLKSVHKLRWEYIDWSEASNASYGYSNTSNWTEISRDVYDNVNIYTSQVVDAGKLAELGFRDDDLVYTSVLTIDALRVLNSGYCYNTTLAPFHLLQPGKRYGFRLYVVADSIINDRYDEYFYSDALNVSTNQFATDGECILQLLDQTSGTARLLDKFYFDCEGWYDPDSLTSNYSLGFNGLMNDVLINNALLSSSWTSDPSSIIGVIGTKALKIKILIRDDLGAITCYDIDIDKSFPSASISDEEILEAIRRIIRENKLGEENAIAVALDTILEGLLYINYANTEILAQIMDLIVQNVVDTSYATNPVETSSGRVLSESTMMRGLLSDDRLIFSNSANTMVASYLPQLYTAIDLEIISAPVVQLDQAIGDSLGQIGLKSLDLAGRLEQFMEQQGLAEFDINANEALESFVEFSAYSGHVALAQSYPGAEFVFEDPVTGKKIVTKKIDPNATAINEQDSNHCGIPEGNSIEIPNIFDSFFDCSFVEQSDAFFQPDNDYDQTLRDQGNTLSKTVTFNLYNGDVYNSVFDHRRRRMLESDEYQQRRRRRRRMQQTDEDESAFDLSTSLLASTDIKDRCDPYWISFNLSQNEESLYTPDQRGSLSFALGENTPYPACTFWDVSRKEWSTDNCFVYNYTEHTVLCACSHLTTFNVKASDFRPEANIVTIYDFRELTQQNLTRFPVVWITLLVILVVFLVICVADAVLSHKDNLPPMAYRDIMFRPIRDEKVRSFLPSTTTNVFEDLYNEKHKHYGLGLIKTVRKDNNLCLNQLRLWRIYLSDNHTLLSVFQHSEGSNYSPRERVATFYLYLCTIMVSSAAFYGVEQQRFGDVTASFLASLWSMIPSKGVQLAFKKAYPSVTPLTIHVDGVDDATLRKVDLSQLPCDEPENELTEADKKRYAEVWELLEMNKSKFEKVDKKMLDEMMQIIIRSRHKLFRMAFMDYVRDKLLRDDHGWPHALKLGAWIFLMLWCAGCSVLAMVYGIQFDLKYGVEENEAFSKRGYDEQCWDMNPQLLINQELSEQQVEQNIEGLNNNFGSHVPDASSWLLSLLESTLLSLFLWQPLTIYFITWLNIWLFSWNLPISLKPPILIKLVKKVCGCQEAEEQKKVNPSLSGGKGKLQLADCSAWSSEVEEEQQHEHENEKDTEKEKTEKQRKLLRNNDTVDLADFIELEIVNAEREKKSKQPSVARSDSLWSDSGASKRAKSPKSPRIKKGTIRVSGSKSPKNGASKNAAKNETVPSSEPPPIRHRSKTMPRKRTKSPQPPAGNDHDKSSDIEAALSIAFSVEREPVSSPSGEQLSPVSPVQLAGAKTPDNRQSRKNAHKVAEKAKTSKSVVRSNSLFSGREAKSLKTRQAPNVSIPKNSVSKGGGKVTRPSSARNKNAKNSVLKSAAKNVTRPSSARVRSETMSNFSRSKTLPRKRTKSPQPTPVKKHGKAASNINTKRTATLRNASSAGIATKRSVTIRKTSIAAKSIGNDENEDDDGGQQKLQRSQTMQPRGKNRKKVDKQELPKFAGKSESASVKPRTATISEKDDGEQKDFETKSASLRSKVSIISDSGVDDDTVDIAEHKVDDEDTFSPFAATVEKYLANSNEAALNDKYALLRRQPNKIKLDDLYENIVSHHFRPFDVYAFFGTQLYFFDLVNTWYGLDVKGYEKPEPIVEESESEEAKPMKPQRKVAPWASAVGYS